MEMATPNRLEPDSDLFCPHCGGNIENDMDYDIDEVAANMYLARNVSLVQMKCGAIVQDGEFLHKSEAREMFG